MVVVMLTAMVIATANVMMVVMIVVSMATFVRVTKDNVSLCRACLDIFSWE